MLYRNNIEADPVSSLKVCLVAALLCVMLAPAPAALASKSARVDAAAEGGPRVVSSAATGDVYAACVFVPVGTALETEVQRGITGLLNSVILNGGGVSPEDSPAYVIEGLGGRVDAVTYGDYACFRLAAPSDGFARALGVLAGAVRSPNITEYALESEKLRLEAQTEKAGDAPETDAYRTFIVKTYEGTPYANLPYTETGSMPALGVAELEGWHGEHYAFSGMVVSVVAGSSPSEAAAFAMGAFGDCAIPEGKRASLINPVACHPVTESVTFESPSRLGGSAAMLGYTAPPMGSPDYAAVKLAEAVVAEGMGSRLFRSLRGEDRLAYSFGSILPEAAGFSRLAFYVSADEEKLERAVEVLKGSVDALRSGGITDDEMDRARAAVIGGIDMAASDPSEEAWHSGLYELMGLGPDYGERLAEQVRELDADDVREAAERYLDKYTLVILRPDSRIR